METAVMITSTAIVAECGVPCDRTATGSDIPAIGGLLGDMFRMQVGALNARE